MNISIFIPFIALILGVLGGIVRGLSLINGYEPQTLLPVIGHSSQLILIALSVVSAVIIAVLSAKKRNIQSFEQAFASESAGFKTISVISAMLIGLCGAGGFYIAVTTPNQPFYSKITEFPLWLLAVFSAAAIIFLTLALSRNNINESNAYFVLVPMFWAAFDLIVIFKNNTASPFVGYYSFELLPSIFLTLAFYTLAGFLYSKIKPARMMFFGSMAIIFSLICSVSTLFAHIINPAMWSFELSQLLRCGCFIGAALWILALLINLGKADDKASV